MGRQTGRGQRWSGGAAVPPHQGYSEDACCSFPAGPVAVLAAGDGEQRGRLPMGAVWATRVARAARRLARARRASAMDTMEDHTRTTDERFRRTPTWHAKCRIWGSGRPLRFEHLGACGDLSPTDLRPISSCDLSWKQRTTQGTRGLYRFRRPLWCNTLLQCVVWWIASGADDEQYKGRTAP